MRKNKAFTLIELVAVLVILAVVSLIIMPLILNTIRKVKDSANKRSIDAYGRAVEYAMSSYHLEHLKYPDTFDKLDIRTKGSKVECETSRINPDYSIYLTKCKVNGKLVKDDKNKDGYYHFGTLKMTNIEYVDTYGKNLEAALKKYHDEHNEYPSNYTTLTLPTLEKDVACSVDINPDGTVYLNNCKVDNEDVLDNNNEVYVYGDLYATTVLLKKTNNKSITTYTDGNTHEMYTFDHEATEQTPALTDYRYIGNEPYNYVRFNNETWRIIGVFDTDDGTGTFEKRIKILRNAVIQSKQWNSSGVNEWVESTIQIYLNNTYIINEESEKLAKNAKWYLGGIQNYRVNGSAIYTRERSNITYSGRSKNWVGIVGLMYPSDYTYIYSLDIDVTCYNDPKNCNNSTPTLGWLYNSKNHQWFLSPNYGSSNASYVFNSGLFYHTTSTGKASVRPTLYLKHNVKIKLGDGSVDSPYQFEL